jgi:hypothetical protein
MPTRMLPAACTCLLLAGLLALVSGCNYVALFPSAAPTPAATPSVRAGAQATAGPSATPTANLAATAQAILTAAAATPSRAATAAPTPTPFPSVAPATASPTAKATLAPTPTSTAAPAPTATPTAPGNGAGKGTIAVQSLSIPTYPFERFLQDAMDTPSGIPYKRLNWDAYLVSSPSPAPKIYKAVVLENSTLQLTFLPELGGRLYRAVYKPTGSDLFYRNPVIKPTRWGPAQQGWWLGAGGVEWALPVDEHGLEWGMPWEYSTARTDGASTITLLDSQAGNRLRARITVSLPDSGAGFDIAMRLENPTAGEKRYQFWLNAMIGGPGGRVAPDTVFLFPTDRAIVHSTDDPSLPQPRGSFVWPLAGQRNLSRYAEWQGYLGIFAATPGGRQGAYSPTARLGIIRAYPADAARGAKLFVGKGLDPSLWTDDGSTYFEMWGGANRTFFPEDDRVLAPGAAVEWRETWSVTTSGLQ